MCVFAFIDDAFIYHIYVIHIMYICVSVVLLLRLLWVLALCVCVCVWPSQMWHYSDFFLYKEKNVMKKKSYSFFLCMLLFIQSNLGDFLFALQWLFPFMCVQACLYLYVPFGILLMGMCEWVSTNWAFHMILTFKNIL